MKRWLVLLLWLIPVAAWAAPQDAVVRIPSHGGSGVVIATGPGWSFILSAKHMFKGAKERARPIVIDIPLPDCTPTPKCVGTQLLGVDPNSDAALLRLNYGPLPFVDRVAPRNFQPGDCLSIGFDEMKYPVTVRPARIVGKQGVCEFTDRRPWHGRSGGGLIDVQTGLLVGICSGYTGERDHLEIERGCYGVYVELGTILNFIGTVPGVALNENPQAPPCPDGRCPLQSPPPTAPWTPLPPQMIFGAPCPH